MRLAAKPVVYFNPSITVRKPESAMSPELAT
jgi:hypothetical protein